MVGRIICWTTAPSALRTSAFWSLLRACIVISRSTSASRALNFLKSWERTSRQAPKFLPNFTHWSPKISSACLMAKNFSPVVGSFCGWIIPSAKASIRGFFTDSSNSFDSNSKSDGRGVLNDSVCSTMRLRSFCGAASRRSYFSLSTFIFSR